MSSNTQAQGRSYLTEAGFTYVPVAGDDIYRAQQHFQLQYDAQLVVGSVTFDAAAKQAVLDAANAAPAPAPAPAP